jgi:hypothetical protein
MPAISLESVLTCPRCGFAKTETMPTDACQFYYECENCKVLLRPKPGDCCVFCSYGSAKCPSVQQSSFRQAGALGRCSHASDGPTSASHTAPATDLRAGWQRHE